MNTIDVAQFEKQFFELVEKAQHGQETVVTKDGKPILKLIPFADKPDKTNKSPTTVKPTANR